MKIVSCDVCGKQERVGDELLTEWSNLEIVFTGHCKMSTSIDVCDNCGPSKDRTSRSIVDRIMNGLRNTEDGPSVT